MLLKENFLINVKHKESQTVGGGAARSSIFDILKGIGIILVVLGHCGFIYTNFIYMFHMPLFFIVTGYFFKELNYDNWLNVKNFIVRKIKFLYVPYVLTNLIFLYCTQLFIKLHFYSAQTPENIMMKGYDIIEPLSFKLYLIKTFEILILYLREPLSGPTWFLKVLFFISVFSCIGHYICKKIFKNTIKFQIARFLIYLLLFMLGNILHLIKCNFYQIGTILTSCMFFYDGICYQKYQNKIKITYISFLISFIILLLSYLYQYPYRTEISVNSYLNPFIILLTSITGFIFLLSISKFLNNNEIVKNILAFIGANTLWILCLHSFCFRCLTCLHVFLYGEPISFLYKHAVGITTGNGWWILYTIIGISGPLVIKKIFSYINCFCKKIYLIVLLKLRY